MPHEVQVWAVDVSAWNCAPYTRVDPRPVAYAFDADVEALLGHDAGEAQRVRRYLRGIDRVRSLVARLLPRLLVAQGGECAWRDVRMAATPEGRPYVCAPAAQYDLNLTHDGDWVVMAFSPHTRVGVDVMQVALPPMEESTRTFCATMAASMTPAERAWVAAPAAEREVLERLLHVWTYKEALTKNMGHGLGFDFARIQVPLAPDDTRLWVAGAVSDAYRFVDVALPSGAAHAQPGSRVAVALGPRAWAGAPRVESVPHDEAVRAGWLRVWTYEAVVREAHAACYRSSGVWKKAA